MKIQWTIAALLSSALIVGCGDRGSETTQNLEENRAQAPATGATGDEVNPPAATAPAPSVSPRVDDPAARVEPAPSRPATARPATPREDVNREPARTVRPEPGNTSTAAVPARPTWREVTVPANTALPLELMTALSSATATVETPVRARLRSAVMVDGATAIPAGATLVGEVTEVQRPGRVQGRSRLVIRFNEVQMNGSTEALRTNPVIFEGEATKGEDATKIGIGAGIGAAIGGILGGGDGAAKGGAIGGAAGTGAVLATRGQDVELASGAEINPTLATPFEARVPAR